MDMEKEITEKIIELGADIAGDIIRPTSKSVGDNIGLLVDGVMGWLGYWGEKQKIKREIYLADYKNKITEKINEIPADKVIEPPLRIVGPAVEASKYFIEEEEMRDIFAQLIASACNSDIAGEVHPFFQDVIRQMRPFDAKFLSLFRKEMTMPVAKVQERHKDAIISPYISYLFPEDVMHINGFNYSEQLEMTKTVELLITNGLMVIQQNILELGFDYESFKCHWLYKTIAKNKEPDSELIVLRYRLELTELGKSFVKCCISDEIKNE